MVGGHYMPYSKFLLVNPNVLPPVFQGVVLAKRYLLRGDAKTTGEAAKLAGISRSAFYKYKDHVFDFGDHTHGKIITIKAMLKDESGVLSAFISEIYSYGANILTVNQGTPNDGAAQVSISLRTNELTIGADHLAESLTKIKDVLSVTLISGE